MASQLIFANLKEHKLSLDYFLNIFPAIKYVCLDLGLGYFCPEHIFRIEVVERRRAFCKQKLGIGGLNKKDAQE